MIKVLITFEKYIFGAQDKVFYRKRNEIYRETKGMILKAALKTITVL